MSAEIRNVPFADAPVWLKALRTNFYGDPAGEYGPPQQEWWSSQWDQIRVFGAYDAGRCVATLRTFGTTVSVPGAPGGDCALVPADALTQVTVAATHRRQGLLTGMLSQSLADAAERGEVLSVLRAAEWPIYGRFGYAPATWESAYRLNSRSARGRLAPAEGLRAVQLEPEEALAPLAEVYAGMRRGQAGHIDRPEAMARRRFGLGGLQRPGERELVFVAVVDTDDRPHGLTAWAATGVEDENYYTEVILHDLVASSPDGHRALWHYLVNLDLVHTLVASERPVDDPLEWWLADGRALRRTGIADAVWVRLLDVPAALAARRWAVTDRLVLEVVDEDTGGYGAGRFILDGGPEHSSCEPTSSLSADLRLSQRALAALYLGGNTVGSQVLAGLVDVLTPGADHRLALMLAADRAPWNATSF